MMIIIDIARPGDGIYPHVSQFAQRVYAEKLQAVISATPEAFAYAHKDERIVGCFGLYCAEVRNPLLIETYVSHPFEEISGLPSPDRRQCGELGTRAVAESEVRSGDISIALSALLVMFAYKADIRYLAFTANRTVGAVADALGFSLIRLGKPDLSGKDETFLKNWQEFFQLSQQCFGFRVASIAGCQKALEKLALSGIVTHSEPNASRDII